MVDTHTITLDEANELSGREESHFFDRKSVSISGKQVQKMCVAFANADGGEFLIGVADNKDEPDPRNRWLGKNTIEEFNGHLQAIFDVQPTLDLRYE